VISTFKKAGIRTSLFVDPVVKMVAGAAETGADRIELYTEEYAKLFKADKLSGIEPYAEAARIAEELGLGINAGHDLNLDNIRYLKENIPQIKEVSIGHALVCEAIYLGLENVVNMYLHRLQ
ncbi:MAG: pyridoxine 5'-phosphate synthase, partial [Flavobacteriaceae bacterium]